MARLRNIGDEAGANIRLSWNRRVDDNPIDRIDPGFELWRGPFP
jgi:hypothetical protein